MSIDSWFFINNYLFPPPSPSPSLSIPAFVKSLLSMLVVVPGHPEHGPFYIIQGLLNALPRYSWQTHTGVQTKIYTDMIALLCSLSQKKFIYHMAYVDSNDVLYANGAEYTQNLLENLNICIEEIVKQLTVFTYFLYYSILLTSIWPYLLTLYILSFVVAIWTNQQAMGERGDATAKLNQARMILDLLNQIVSRMELSEEVLFYVFYLYILI